MRQFGSDQEDAFNPGAGNCGATDPFASAEQNEADVQSAQPI